MLMQDLFARLRRRVATGVWIEALGVAAVAFAGFVLASYVLDRLLRLEVPYRAGFLLALFAGLAWIVWTRLVKPLRARLADDELAGSVRQIERWYRTTRNPGTAETRAALLRAVERRYGGADCDEPCPEMVSRQPILSR